MSNPMPTMPLYDAFSKSELPHLCLQQLAAGLQLNLGIAVVVCYPVGCQNGFHMINVEVCAHGMILFQRVWSLNSLHHR